MPYTYRATCQMAIAGVVIAAMSLQSPQSIGQGVNGPGTVVRHQGDIYDEWADDRPTWQGVWDRIDAARTPQHPDLVSEDLIPEAVLHRLINHLSAEQGEKAEEHGRLLVELCPTRPAAWYNFACVLAQRGKADEAFAALDRAIELGWRQHQHTQVDTSLDPIRGHERFEALMRKLERLIEHESVRPVPLRTDESLQAILDDLKTFIPDELRRHQAPGLAIALVRNGNVVWTDAFGRVDGRTTEPMTDRTLFRAHAPKRLLISLLSLRMHEQGIWDLDEPLAKWLPFLRFADSTIAEDLTIRRALNFSGGLRYRRLLDLPDELDEEIRESFLISQERVSKRYGYIPQSYLAVGRAIERAMESFEAIDPTVMEDALGRPVEEFIRSQFTVPLLLNRTYLRQPTQPRFVRATGHTEFGTPYREPVVILRPDSPLYTTAKDLAGLIAFLVDAGAYDAGPLSPKSVSDLYRPGLKTPIDSEAVPYGFGLGVRVMPTEFGLCVETGDVERGVGSLMRWYPDSKCGVVILFNSDDGMEMARRIAHRALGGV